jgi:hypothetical protein
MARVPGACVRARAGQLIGGSWSWRASACSPDRTAARCLRACRADGKGPWWYVPEVTCCDGKGRPTIPKKADGFYSWYYLRATNDDFAGTPTFMLRYRLPASFTCDRWVRSW